MKEKGTLYLVATPIGNLKDITLRALEILQSVDLIAAEDTRHTQKLLAYFEIKTPLISYHQHNARERAVTITEKLLSGSSIAVVSDAGMPGISDPGYWVVKEAVAKGITVSPVPGANAALSGLVVSGLPTDRFVFEGFLPRKKEQLKQRLRVLTKEERTIIFYEAPHRIKQTLVLCKEFFGGERQAVIARELTKKFEEIIRGNLEELTEMVSSREIKGEFCIVVAGAPKQEQEEQAGAAENWWNHLSVIEHVDLLIGRGVSTSEAIKQVAKIRKLSKREVYNRYHREKTG
ncbi:MAG: 16S rRNA (cytidine(1402)-2'-O)-methyltransferase [Thermoanaerobacteraceae bacterium]|nr:16S rRNA (cytidine(1402)-2'-O)-methyltransferase [Thermoanaerobacteraceae bacterium]